MPKMPNQKLKLVYLSRIFSERTDRYHGLTLSEISASRTAAILIPSPNVADNHQYKNAKALLDVNAARLIEEKDLSSEALVKEVDFLLKNPEYSMFFRVYSP